MKKPLSGKQYGGSIRGEFDKHRFDDWKKSVKEESSMLWDIRKACDLKNSSYYKYQLYLTSDAWRAKRALVLERDKNLCQACKQKPAEDVHHLTYDHLFDELLEELIALCRACHNNVHAASLQG